MALEIVRAVDDGREFFVRSLWEIQQFDDVVPGDLLNDEIGDDAPQSDREAWIRANSDDIVRALIAKKKGGLVRSPFHRIALREVI